MRSRLILPPVNSLCNYILSFYHTVSCYTTALLIPLGVPIYLISYCLSFIRPADGDLKIYRASEQLQQHADEPTSRGIYTRRRITWCVRKVMTLNACLDNWQRCSHTSDTSRDIHSYLMISASFNSIALTGVI